MKEATLGELLYEDKKVDVVVCISRRERVRI